MRNLNCKTVFAVMRSTEPDDSGETGVEVSRVFALLNDAEEFLANRLEHEKIEWEYYCERVQVEANSGKPFRAHLFPDVFRSTHLESIQTCTLWLASLEEL